MKNNRFNYLFCKSIIVSFFLTLLFTSCEPANERILTRDFPQNISLKAKKIPVKKVLNPVDIILTDNHFIFQNDHTSGEDCYYVFDKEMRFCYSFGRLGNGPNEFIAPRGVNGKRKENQFLIFDSASDKIFEYKLGDEKPVFISETKIVDVMYPTQYLSKVNDSILIYRIYDNEGCKLYSYHLFDKVVVDTLQFNTPFKEEMGANYNPNWDIFQCWEENSIILFTFNHIDEVKTGKVLPDGKFSVDRDLSSPCTLNSTTNNDENIAYYMFSKITEKRLYAHYYGYPFLYMQPFPFNKYGRIFNFLIEVYDLDKKPIARLTLDSDILKFVVDEENQKIYTWDFLDDFDYLLEYDISCLNSL